MENPAFLTRRNRGRFLFVISLPMFFSLLSCANTIKVKRDSPHPAHAERINAYGKNRSGTVTLHNEPVKVTWLHLAGDSLTFKDSSATATVSLAVVEKITFKDRWVGLAYGVVLGAGIGTLVGVAYISDDVVEYTILSLESGSEMPGLAILGGIIAGGAIGGVAGYAVGSNIQFVFVAPEPE
jgi:hypothetical protein